MKNVPEQENSLKKMFFCWGWLTFLVLGSILLLVVVHNTTAPVITLSFIGYAGFSGLLLLFFYRTSIKIQKDLLLTNQEDQLTGLKNRRFLKERINKILSRYKRNGNKFALIFFDINNFKHYNDKYGHPVGDQILQEVANYLASSTRQEEPLARYGGDEFVLLLPDSEQQEAASTAKRIKNEMEKKVFSVKGNPVSLEISGGIAVCPDDGTTMEELLEAADQNLYQSKNNLRQIYSPVQNTPEVPEIYPPLLISHDDDYLEKAEKQTTQLYLLAKKGNLEIIKQFISAEKSVLLWGEKNTFEFYYLMEGELIQSRDNKILYPGTTITVQNMPEEIYFKTKTDCTLLYVTAVPVFKDQQKHIEELLSISRKVENSDEQTDQHSHRLQRLSRRTGEILGLTEDQLFALDYASSLHDIGKSEISDAILRKPGKLNQEEWALMKMHPVWGRDMILKNLKKSFFEKVAEIVCQHHERYDGKGYPQGLAGDEIMFEAQILAVVDAYDAMTFDRPYKKAKPRQEVLEEIEKNRGHQFGPRAVEAFLKAEDEFYRLGIIK